MIKPISVGLTLPAEAWPKIRIKIIVITIVTNTTKVAPKLRANSLRSDF
jgi:hypothetical protein